MRCDGASGTVIDDESSTRGSLIDGGDKKVFFRHFSSRSGRDNEDEVKKFVNREGNEMMRKKRRQSNMVRQFLGIVDNV